MLLVDTIVDSLRDTLYLVPFLYVTYLAMEAIEHAGAAFAQRVVRRAGALGPLVGGVLGAVPQCGFSAMAAALYSVRVVGAGTLVAVMLSTSDELIPVFVAGGAPPALIGQILGFKIVVAIVVGFLVSLAVRVWFGPPREPTIASLCEREGCDCDDDDEDEPDDEDEDALDGNGDEGNADDEPESVESEPEGAASHAYDHAHDHPHAHGSGHGMGHIWRAAAVHTVKVTFFIFCVNLVLGFVFEAVGEDVISEFLIARPEGSVVLAALVGLIPNCAASVIVSELYLEGVLGTGALLSGLLVTSGVAPLVLFRTDRSPARDLGIMGILFIVGVVVGLAANLAGFAFG